MADIRTVAEHDGGTVCEALLQSGRARVSILNYGCVIRDWRVIRPDGQEQDVVLGFDRFEDYPEHSRSFGIIAGRVANRIGHGRFRLDGQDVQLSTSAATGHHLHGGTIGLGRRLWQMEADSAANAVRLNYHSPHGEEGYPGAVDFEVVISLSDGDLRFEMSARPDRPTPVNLAQHSYYNLDGHSDVSHHRLWLDADRYTPVDAGLIPTGQILPVGGTRFDFQTETPVATQDPETDGIDLNLMLREGRDVTAPAATLMSPHSGLGMKLWTDQPAVQLYTAASLSVDVPGLNNRRYGPFSGVCLEAQIPPDSVNQPDFPSSIVTPEAPYHQSLTVQIA